MSKIYTVILAAGKGTRMPSAKPKALQTLLGESMLTYVYNAVKEHSNGVFTVVGHGAEEIKTHYKTSHFKLYGSDAEQNSILQTEQLGTGHALLTAYQAMEQKIEFSKNDKILIVNADTPLLTSEIIGDFIEKSREMPLTFLSLNLEDPGSYGRVLREDFSENAKNRASYKDLDKGKVHSIIEAKDFKVLYPDYENYEVNSGIYLINLDIIAKYLPQLSTDNLSKEYYLTDIVALAKDGGYEVEALCFGENKGLLGVNSPYELYAAEKYLQEVENIRRMQNGIVIHQPESVRIGPFAGIAKGVEIFGPCEVYGSCTIGQFSCLESHTVLKNTDIGESCLVRSFSHLEAATVKNNVTLGPYARLRPGAELENNCHIGNFVEIKKSKVGQGSKVNHLSYIGDATLGSNVNVGAGSITCNYDGEKKHQTIIGDNSFLGSNTSYVAPVKIGKNVLVGAGSVITKDVPDSQVALSRSEQKTINKRKK